MRCARICYIASVPVANTTAGPVQLYRLLQDWHPANLRIVELDAGPIAQQFRLPHVVHHAFKSPCQRGLRFTSRFLPFMYRCLTIANARASAHTIIRQVKTFSPSAILTLHDRFGWLPAARVARRLGVPLHLILHDDWCRNVPVSASLRRWFDTLFEQTYQEASGRFCVSPNMMEEYARRYGVPGTVLYPIQEPCLGSLFQAPLRTATSGLSVAFAGNIFSSGQWEMLRALAGVLASINGVLLLLGPTTIEQAKSNGLTGANVRIRGFLPDLKAALREEADVLYLPMSFESHDRVNVKMSFPSKLVEYTSTGLPVLIQAPEYSSAARWCRDHPGAAELVASQSVDELAAALRRIITPGVRRRLIECATEVGRACFSYHTGVRILHDAINESVKR